MRAWCWGLLLLNLFGALNSLALAAPEPLQLLGRSSVEGYRVQLAETDWRWLRDKDRLLLGASAPDYPPFENTINEHNFEGITADFAALLGQLLHMPIEVRRYDSRAAVIAALKAGEIDLLGAANGFEAADPQLVLTSAYAEDAPILVTRLGESKGLSGDLANRRLAMLDHYLPPETVAAAYPNARLEVYSSTLSAMGAVAFGGADAYLGDSVSASYLINNNYLSNVELAQFARMEVNPFGFALSRENLRLRRIIDTALAAIPEQERTTILRRWSPGSPFSNSQRVQLSASEQRWLEQHPAVKVGYIGTFAPLAFAGENARFSGLSAQVLDRISLRTGLKFEAVRGESFNQQLEQLKAGQLDLLAVITPSVERQATLRFTRPYLSNPYVLVCAIGNKAPVTLDDLAETRGGDWTQCAARADPGPRRRCAFHRGRQPGPGHGPGGQWWCRCGLELVDQCALHHCPAVPRQTAGGQHRGGRAGAHQLRHPARGVRALLDSQQGLAQHRPGRNGRVGQSLAQRDAGRRQLLGPASRVDHSGICRCRAVAVAGRGLDHLPAQPDPQAPTAARPGAAGAGRRRSRQPCQDHLPGDHEPRNPHPDERNHQRF